MNSFSKSHHSKHVRMFLFFETVFLNVFLVVMLKWSDHSYLEYSRNIREL
jgi:hypothetical protein